ncbi:MAG: hypothetical protein K2J39_09025 [Ruminococcus sp.]|nr:hypothetical protein [Ruminococcus sp.]
MKVLLTELKKLFSNKIFLLIIVSVFVLNAYLVFRTANSGEATPADYKMIYSEIDGLSDDEKLEWFNERTSDFTGQYRYNWKLMYKLQEDCDNVVNYSEYLENIKSQADSMTSVSIFAKPDTFNYRSIVRTPPAYENVQNVQPFFDISQGIILATDNNFTDILCGFIILFATLLIMISDSEQGLSRLLFSLKRGRSYLIYMKLATLMTVISIMIVLIYSENLIITSYIYGLGDLSRPIQSVSGFIGCNLNITVTGYLFLYLLFKIIAFGATGAVLTLIAVNTKNIVSFYSISAVIFITESLAYVKIHILSVYSVFRYINLISFTKVNEIFCNYKNINFFEYPVPLIPTSVGAVIVISLICGILSAYLYAKKRNLEFKKVNFRFKIRRSKIHSLYYYTFYKSLIMQKGLVIIAVFIAVTGFVNQNFYKKYDVVDVYYRYYTELLDGEITQETIDFCNSESQKFSDIQNRIDELSQDNSYSFELNELYRQLAPSMGFYPVRERMEMIKDIDNTQLFYDTGYKRILGINGYDDDMKYALIAMLMCTFLVSPLIANDNKYRMKYIVNSTSSGKKSYIKRNIFTAVIYGFFVAVLWIVPYLITIKRYYGNSGLSASVRSITDFTDFPINIKLWQYILIVLLLRTFSVICISLMMLYISAKCRNTISAVLINIALFVLPIVIYLLGAEFAVNLIFNPLLSINIILNNPAVIQFAIPSGLIILSVIIDRINGKNI